MFKPGAVRDSCFKTQANEKNKRLFIEFATGATNKTNGQEI